MKYFNKGDYEKEADYIGIHRDDHYLFFMVESGSAALMIDFQSVTFGQNSLYFVLPGQVHHRIKNNEATGWFLAVDTALLTAEQRQVFEQRLTLQRPVTLNEEEQTRYNKTLNALYAHYVTSREQPFYLQILSALLQAFTGMVAAQFKTADAVTEIPGRKTELTLTFKILLSEHFKLQKSPSAYAAMLCVSPAYLNEAIKQVTGLPATYWIAHEVMLEAKRLLHYSKLNVKQIAHELGYEDHTYFSRLFKQHTAITPLAFRNQYSE